ncbi:DUF4276 family protein [Paraburkholderia sp. J63]|uniref:DUF4276 family protein n=1 Tax=Paraburkholderia sp. J63 TaxID=2805434 RepID=UPI002ABDC60F|nr:DUF4276 family protein [Paraburkholderia sp. J63]
MVDLVILGEGQTEEVFVREVLAPEFEALLFSDVRRFGEVTPQWIDFEHELERIRADFETPEHINDSPFTAPSKRLTNLLTPTYQKTRHGPVIAKRIGLATLRAACPHFGAWIRKLTALQPL